MKLNRLDDRPQQGNDYQSLRAWRTWAVLLVVAGVLGMSGCSVFKKSPSDSGKGGGYYQNDGPGDPSRLDGRTIRDAVPRVDPLLSGPNKPYTVAGKRYVPDTREVPFRQRGVASWYGKQFHGRPTSSGEKYDMYGMTAAHTTLPIPCYVRVTSVANGRSIIVRVNDRGPFSNKRVIDLSYAAAHKLGYINQGTTEVIVERIMPANIRAGRVPATGSASNAPNSAGSNAPTPSHPPASSGSTSPSNTPNPPPNSSNSGSTNNTSNSNTGRPQEISEASIGTVTGNTQSRPAGVLSGGYFVQMGAYSSQESAQALANRVFEKNDNLRSALRITYDGTYYRVFAGPYNSQEQAQEVGTQIEAQIGVRVLVLNRP